MAPSNVVFLANAREARARAEKARRLSLGISDLEVIERLQRYARELEKHAQELERLAAKLGQTVSRTQVLAADIKGAVEAAQQTIDQIKNSKK